MAKKKNEDLIEVQVVTSYVPAPGEGKGPGARVKVFPVIAKAGLESGVFVYPDDEEAVAASDDSPETTALRAALSKAKADLDAAKAKVKELTVERDTLKADLDTATAEIAKINGDNEPGKKQPGKSD